MSVENDTYTLRISEAFPEDEGEYKCVATNSAGTASTTAHLTVVGKFHSCCKVFDETNFNYNLKIVLLKYESIKFNFTLKCVFLVKENKLFLI